MLQTSEVSRRGEEGPLRPVRAGERAARALTHHTTPHHTSRSTPDPITPELGEIITGECIILAYVPRQHQSRLAELLDTLRVDGSGIWTGIKGGCDPTSADPYSDFTAYFSKSEIMAAEPKVTPPLTTYPPPHPSTYNLHTTTTTPSQPLTLPYLLLLLLLHLSHLHRTHLHLTHLHLTHHPSTYNLPPPPLRILR